MKVADAKRQARNAAHMGGASADIRSAAAYLTEEVERIIAREGKALSDFGRLLIIIDRPSGFALKCLSDTWLENAVVFTNNPCPEYWEDLWDLKPQVLLVGNHDASEFVSALTRADKGEHFRRTPRHESELTLRERDVLRLCATGLANKEIAAQLNLAQSTVKNKLSSAFSKLGLVGREQAMLYYWGLWHWLTAE